MQFGISSRLNPRELCSVFGCLLPPSLTLFTCDLHETVVGCCNGRHVSCFSKILKCNKHGGDGGVSSSGLAGAGVSWMATRTGTEMTDGAGWLIGD